MKVHTTVGGAWPTGLAGRVHTWDSRAAGWDHSGVPGLDRVAGAVLRHAGDLGDLDIADMGCGSGQITLEVAKRARSVVAIDFSPAMLLRLQERAAGMDLGNITTVLAPLQSLDLAPRSVDVVVSNYACHHLRDGEKAELVARAAGWLRPGGVIVIGDMMFSPRGTGRSDRRIIASKVTSIARRGPAGWWRIAKNAWRFLVTRQECPASMEAWEAMLTAAGFGEIRSERVVADGAVVSARRSEK
ncbi:MAG TPA: class I SAM-dependent methyltransferase, partial [Acidimicrobiales bacterium]|nr:class I SAM-dependent methyltransferase [Acidimicrobiales bacterium]